ncbi:hypothetical protein DY000_02047157 [Brassica cretica]|uniref:Uncharacterized protein n=1 Tax=Brassica cretica TaxID=69181 RepID=A0ABQ7F3U6_BRACR|nr:hypothetical protein DY000_02047157 [Brassica cretica]
MGPTSPERHREVAVTPFQSDLARATPRCRSRLHRSEARERPYSDVPERHHKVAPAGSDVTGATQRDQELSTPLIDDIQLASDSETGDDSTPLISTDLPENSVTPATIDETEDAEDVNDNAWTPSQPLTEKTSPDTTETEAIVAYCDAYYAGDHDTRRSTTGNRVQAWFRSNCQVLVRAIGSKSSPIELYGLVCDIELRSSLFDYSTLSFISRFLNLEADLLVKSALCNAAVTT